MHFVLLFVLLWTTSGMDIPPGSPPPVIDIVQPPPPPPVIDIVKPPPPSPVTATAVVKPPSCFDTICGCTDCDTIVPPCNDNLLLGRGRFLKAIDIKERNFNTHETKPLSPTESLSFVQSQHESLLNNPEGLLQESEKDENILEGYDPSEIPPGSPPPIIDIVEPPPPPPIVTAAVVKPPTCFDAICGCTDCDVDIGPFPLDDKDLFLGTGRFLKIVDDKRKRSPLCERLIESLAAQKNVPSNAVNKPTNKQEFYGAPYVGRPLFARPYPRPYPYYPPFRPAFPPVAAAARCASCQALAREKARDLALDDLLIRQTIEIKRKRLREQEREREAGQRQQANKAAVVN